MYKVFINDTVFCIANNFKGDSYIRVEDLFFYLNNNSLSKDKYNVLCDSFEDFTSYFRLLNAAGGVVFNNNNILFIYKNNKWDLPKGKQDAKEIIENTAIREVQEQTGLADVLITSFLDKTFHIYFDKTWILKTTYWFLMNSQHKKTRPQVAEGITRVQWVPKENINHVISDTYLNIKYLFDLI